MVLLLLHTQYCCHWVACVVVSDRREFAGVPPRDMPADLAWAYTRCGAIEQVGYYVDDTAGGSGTHYVWPHDDIVQYLNAMQQHAGSW